MDQDGLKNNFSITTNYHTHTYLCGHAEGIPEDYISRAVKLGYTDLGMSCHGPMPSKAWDGRMDMDGFHNIYLKNIDESALKFKGQINIHKGLEIEYFKEDIPHYKNLLKYVNFLILGQHIINYNGKETSVFRDMTPQKIEAYADQVIEGMETGLFRILAHPEIFCYSYHHWDEACTQASTRIIESAIKNDCLLELNVNGLRKRKVIDQHGQSVWRYPRREFWNLVTKYPEAQTIINDDAHYVTHLNDRATKKIYKFAQELKLNITQFI